MTLDQILKHIEQQGIVSLKIFDLSDNLVGQFPGYGKTATVNEVLTFIKGFAEDFSGKYSIVAKNFSKGSDKDAFRFKAELLPNNPGPLLNGTAPVPGVSRDEIEAQVRAEIAREQKELDLREQLKHLKALNKELELPLQKLAHAGTFLLQGLADKFVPQQTTAMQGTQNGTIDATELENDTMIDEALELFAKHSVDGVFLLALAKRVDEDPKLINMVKQFLNL